MEVCGVTEVWGRQSRGVRDREVWVGGKGLKKDLEKVEHEELEEKVRGVAGR